MTIAQQIGRVNANLETATRAREFVAYAKHLLAAKGGVGEALHYAEGNRATPGILNVLKSALEAGGTTTDDWGSELATFSNGFAASPAGFGAYDRMLSDNAFTRMPMKTRMAVVTVAISGATVNEAKPKPISKFVFTNPTLEPRKSTAIVVVTEELAKSAAPAAFTLLGDELRKGVARNRH